MADIEFSRIRVRDAFGTRDVIGVVLEELDQGQHRIAVLGEVVATIDGPPTVLCAAAPAAELDDTAAALVALDERVAALEHPGS